MSSHQSKSHLPKLKKQTISHLQGSQLKLRTAQSAIIHELSLLIEGLSPDRRNETRDESTRNTFIYRVEVMNNIE